MINMCLKRVLSVVMMTLMMFSQAANNVYAAGTLDCTISEFIHGADGGLYITISGRAKGSVSVFVYESTIDPTEFSSVNMPVAFEQYDLRPGLTEFEYIIPLPSELEVGSYDIKVVAKDGSYKFIEDYFFLNEEVVQAAKDEVNAAILVSPYAVSEALSANADNLLIDQTDINTYGGFASELLFSRRDSEGQHIQYETIEDLIKAFSEAKAIYIVENRGSDKTLEKAIEENKSALGISLTAGYQINLTDSAKAELYVLLEDNKEWKTKSYSNVYKEMTALASVKKAESWSTLKSVVTDWYKDIININTTKYAKILDDIFVEMIKYQCDTFEDIKIKFDLAVDTVKDDSSGSGSGFGSGSGSGSASSGGGSAGGGAGMAVTGDIISSIVADVNEKETYEFIDLPNDHWAIKEIQYLVENKVFTGYPDGTFGGSKHITRAEFATILAKAFSLTGFEVLPFEDVKSDSWYKDYVGTCYYNGIINGTSETTFSPDATITREDACVMIYRLISDDVAIGNNEINFTDSGEISDYALSAIKALYNAKLVNGIGEGKIAPRVYIDRQSAAKLIYDSIITVNNYARRDKNE